MAVIVTVCAEVSKVACRVTRFDETKILITETGNICHLTKTVSLQITCSYALTDKTCWSINLYKTGSHVVSLIRFEPHVYGGDFHRSRALLYQSFIGIGQSGSTANALQAKRSGG